MRLATDASIGIVNETRYDTFGNWIDMTNKIDPKHKSVVYGKGHFMCSNCGEIEFLIKEKNYCPNCGAKMAKSGDVK